MSSAGCPTICVDSNGENMITVASDATLHADSTTGLDKLLTRNTTVLMPMQLLAKKLETYRKRKTKNVRILSNLTSAQPISSELIQPHSVFIMNQIEATVLALHLGFNVISPTIAACCLSSKYGITCIVTLDEEGAFASSPLEAWTVQCCLQSRLIQQLQRILSMVF